MDARTFHKELLASDEFAQYSLRSTFFVRKLRGLRLFECIQQVGKLTKASKSFDWSKPRLLGIEPEAWQRCQTKGIAPVLLFCHPRVISEQPRLLLYYRTVAMLSQKGLSSLIGGNIARIEAGRIERLDADWVTKAVVTINSVLSAMVVTAADLAPHDLPGFQFAAAGATIQGSWNNAVGVTGEHAVKTILANHLRDEILQIVWRDGKLEDYTQQSHASLIDDIGEVRVIRLKSGFQILFGSEPDVSLRDTKDQPVVAIEVKAGTDPAGALERLGAAMKSFENERSLNPRVKTVYVVSALTAEVQKRISQGAPFDHTFRLSELLADEATQIRFANLLLRVAIGR